MAIVTLRELLDAAGRGGYGVGAFGISNMEQARAIADATIETQSPVIVMLSHKSIQYAGARYLAHLARAVAEECEGLAVCVHLDHGTTYEACIEAIDLGCSSVMIDASLMPDGRTPASYEHNVETTARVVEAARARGVSVEGELGTLGSIDAARDGQLAQLTDPAQAEDFVERTGVDALAVAIGTSHGAYKFDRPPGADLLAMDVIEEIHRRLPETHLVMHGASSVPPELIEEVNRHGGELRPTFGVPIEELQRGIAAGVRKINVDTDGRLAMTAAVRRALVERPGDYDPRVWLAPTIDAMREVVAARMRQFGQAGHGRDIA